MLKIEITNEDGLSGFTMKKGKKIVVFQDLTFDELNKLIASIFGAVRIIEMAMKGKE